MVVSPRANEIEGIIENTIFKKLAYKSMSLYNCCFTCLPKLFQVVYVHETRKDVGDRLRLRKKFIKLGFVGLGGESSFEALQIHERIMRLHQRQSLHGTRRSGTLQPQRYFARHQLQA